MGTALGISANEVRTAVPAVYEVSQENSNKEIGVEFFRLQGVLYQPFEELPRSMEASSAGSRVLFTILPTTRTVDTRIDKGNLQGVIGHLNKVLTPLLIVSLVLLLTSCLGLKFCSGQRIKSLMTRGALVGLALLVLSMILGVPVSFYHDERLPRVWFDNASKESLVLNIDGTQSLLPAYSHGAMKMTSGDHAVKILHGQTQADEVIIRVETSDDYVFNIDRRNSYRLRFASYSQP